MMFNSVAYLLFLPIAALLYFIIPPKFRNAYLLAASYYFYTCWEPKYALLLLGSTLISYFAGLLISNTKQKGEKGSTLTLGKKSFSCGFNLRKLWLGIALFFNVGILFLYKYLDFAADTVNRLMTAIGIDMQIPLLGLLQPIGISFFTFKALSYVIDVYKGKISEEKNIINYSLYVAFFTQTAAGPIERAEVMLPQFREVKKFDYDRTCEAIILFVWGMFKKVVIADRLAIAANTVFNDIGSYNWKAYVAAALFYTVQIYCDFSGYSDMAIASANIMGFSQRRNFNHPYFSTSIAEFWRRWHISLSSWFRDYIYIPLGGNRVSFLRWGINVMVVFLVSGLWHGAAMTFIIWGALFGVYQFIGRLLQKPRNSLKRFVGYDEKLLGCKIISSLCTTALVAFAWIFFRANTLSDSLVIVKSIAKGLLSGWGAAFDIYSVGLGEQDIILSFAAVALLFIVEAIAERKDVIKALRSQWLPVRWAVYLFFIFVIILFGVYGDFGTQSFIYFQF